MTAIYASDQPLLEISLEREVPDPDSTAAERDAALELLDAIEAFAASWLAPLALGFQVIYRDPESFFDEVGRPERPHHFLRERDMPPDLRVDPPFSESRTEIVEHLDRAVTERALLHALAQAAPPRRIVSMSELTWTAVRALSPAREPAQLDVGGHPSTPAQLRVNDALWYLGPSGIAGPPIKIRATNAHYTTTIVVDVYWDLWIDNAAGRALLDAACDRVARRVGWQRTP